MKTENRDCPQLVLGYPVTDEPVDVLGARAMQWIAAGERGRYFACANPHSLEVARVDPEFALAIREADFVVPDGAGVVLASRILGGSIRQRVTGTDLFLEINGRLEAAGGGRCFLLGSTPETLAAVRRRMASAFPRVEVAGSLAPPFAAAFTREQDRAMIDAVNAARPDVLWVAMTAPKQEKWVHRHRRELQAGFVGPVGAVFDFFAGTVTRSHPWFQRHGMEWLPRLLREPRRLWRRNFISSPKFLLRVALARLAGGARR